MGSRLAIGISLLVLAACQLPGSKPTCTAQIDWVDFIQVGSTQYVATASAGTLAEGDLGPVLAHVKFKVAGNVCDPNYRPKDGDAGYLDPGTPIYEVYGHSPGQLLAARRNGRIEGYVALQPAG